MDIRIKEIMEKNVYFLNEDQSVAEAMIEMMHKGVSGMPIINKRQELIGFISEGDLLNYLFKLGKKHDPLFAEDFAHIRESDIEALDELKAELQDEPVMNLATRKVVTLYEDDTYDDACRCLGKKRIKKVPVVDQDEQLVGVLSRSNMLRFIFEYQLNRS